MRVIIAIGHSLQTKSIEKFLDSIDGVEKICQVEDYFELKQIGLRKKIDLLVTDLVDGDEKEYAIIKEFKQKNKNMKVLFCTSLSFIKGDFERSLRWFELADMVVLQEMELEYLHEIIFSQTKGGHKQTCLPQKVLITSNEATFFLNPEDIIFVEKVNRQLVFHCSERTLSTNGTLTKLEEKLPDYFYRSHRAYLINLRKIKKIISCGRSYQVEFGEVEQKAILSYDRQKELGEYYLEA